MKDYGGYTEINFNFFVSNEDLDKLAECLPYFKEFTLEDGSRPCENYSLEDLFKLAMRDGSYSYVAKMIHLYRWKAGLEEL